MKIRHNFKNMCKLLFEPLLTLSSFAQTKIVKGSVRGDNGFALSGISVLIKGTTQGTVINAENSFSIPIIKNNLLFKY